MNKSCRICGRVINRGGICGACKPPPRKVNPVYHAPDYRRNRKLMIETSWKYARNCWLCGMPFISKTDISADHVIPIAMGGTNELDNLAPAHKICNAKRGSKLS